MSLQQRKLVIAIVLNMLKANNAPPYVKKMLEFFDAVTLAQRLEYLLYHKANSLREYMTPTTLGRRLQYLALYASRHASVVRVKRKLHFESTGSPVTKRTRIRSGALRSSVLFFQNGHQEITGHIVGFLDSKEVIRLRAVNKFAETSIPEFVESVQLTSDTFNLVLRTQSATSFLSRFPKLRTLTITGTPERQQLPFDSNADLTPESMMSELGVAMFSNACSELETLTIRSFFFFQSQSNAVVNFMNALKVGKCSKLKELDLSSNFLSDAGADLIAQILLCGGCPNLKHVELKKNFIGEHGIEAIASSLSLPRCVPLQYLGLAGNVLTTLSVQVLSDAIVCGNCDVLEELDLENNFITSQGAYQLLQSLSIGINIDRFQTVKLRGNQFVPQEKKTAKLISQHLKFNVETV